MNRVIGFDYGDKRIGVAISDPMQIIASELGIIYNIDLETVLNDIQKIIDHFPIEAIVLGLPLNMNDTEGFQAKKVRKFGEELKRFKLPIIYIDERESSKKAESIMKDLKMNVKKIRYESDKKAASIILQDYLDYKS